jgi:RecA/RadA recombinase
MYILDSFDALEAASELKRDFGDRQPGAKAALASEFYRTHIADIYGANCLFLMISQLRDAIGVMFGETKVRSGGKAHDFYASQIVWLATGKAIVEKRSGVELEIGTHTRYRVKKNKIGRPHDRAPLVIYYNYGIDDELSNLEWLQEKKLGSVGRLTIPISDYGQALRDVRTARDMDTLAKMREELRAAVRTRWTEIDTAFAPTMRKY